MGLKTGEFPEVDLETFLDEPLMVRMRTLATHWGEHGFGAPKITHVIYIARLLVVYMFLGVVVATTTSGLPAFWHFNQYWSAPIVYEKFIIWTVLLEAIGFAGSWGPLAGHFRPMTGGILFWARPKTIRLPPWPGKVPFTKGDTRTVGDVGLYLALIASLVAALVVPQKVSVSAGAKYLELSQRYGHHGPTFESLYNHSIVVDPAVLFFVVGLLIVVGLRDKVIFIAARSEQYLPALVFMCALQYVDLIVALKLLIVSVWVGAGVSKFGRHFSCVVPPMVSNTPWITSKKFKRMQYRNFPEDLRPSHYGSALAHIGGTTVECIIPFILLFSTNRYLTIAAVCAMIAFHTFIISTFPLAVPLEWNVLFGFATAFLFIGHPAQHGFGFTDMSRPWLTAIIVGALVFFPILGNLRPDLVSFLPSMRQYAGNWASAMWAFAPGCEEKLNTHIVRSSKNQVDQLAHTYPPVVAEITMQQTIGWRSLHSQGRALFSLMMRHLDERQLNTYTIREAEFSTNSIVAFNFGDGHLHDEKMIAAVQRRCQFAPGEWTIAWIESQPINKPYLQYKVIDAATGVVERGTYLIKDAVEAMPWLPDGPIPFDVTWSRPRTTAEPVGAAPVPGAPGAGPDPSGVAPGTAAAPANGDATGGDRDVAVSD